MGHWQTYGGQFPEKFNRQHEILLIYVKFQNLMYHSPKQITNCVAYLRSNRFIFVEKYALVSCYHTVQFAIYIFSLSFKV